MPSSLKLNPTESCHLILLSLWSQISNFGWVSFSLNQLSFTYSALSFNANKFVGLIWTNLIVGNRSVAVPIIQMVKNPWPTEPDPVHCHTGTPKVHSQTRVSRTCPDYKSLPSRTDIQLLLTSGVWFQLHYDPKDSAAPLPESQSAPGPCRW